MNWICCLLFCWGGVTGGWHDRVERRTDGEKSNNDGLPKISKIQGVCLAKTWKDQLKLSIATSTMDCWACDRADDACIDERSNVLSWLGFHIDNMRQEPLVVT